MNKIQVISFCELENIEPGIYSLNSSHFIEIVSFAKNCQFELFSIDGKKIDNKVELLSQTAKSLRFPEYFGHNWDAFKDCMSDLSWLHLQHGCVIVYSDLNQFIYKSPSEWNNAEYIMNWCINFWINNGRKMFIILLN